MALAMLPEGSVLLGQESKHTIKRNKQSKDETCDIRGSNLSYLPNRTSRGVGGFHFDEKNELVKIGAAYLFCLIWGLQEKP